MEDMTTINMVGHDKAEVAEDEEAIEIIMTIQLGLDAEEGDVVGIMLATNKTFRLQNAKEVEVVATKAAGAETIVTIVTVDGKDEEAGTFETIVVERLDEEIEMETVEETITIIAVGGAVDHGAKVEGVESKTEGKI